MLTLKIYGQSSTSISVGVRWAIKEGERVGRSTLIYEGLLSNAKTKTNLRETSRIDSLFHPQFQHDCCWCIEKKSQDEEGVRRGTGFEATKTGRRGEVNRERLPDCITAHALPHSALALGTFFPCFVQLLARRSLIAEIFVGAEQTESFSFDFVYSFHPHRNLLHLGFDDTALEEKWRAIATLLMTACRFLCFHAKQFSVSLLSTPPSHGEPTTEKGKIEFNSCSAVGFFRTKAKRESNAAGGKKNRYLCLEHFSRLLL